MRTTKKIIVGIALAGFAAAGGAAFTATGVTTTGQAASPQFVGGTVSQSVTGATLSGITYGYSAGGTNTLVNTIDLTFAGLTAEGRPVSVTPSGGTGGTFTCSDVDANASACSYTPAVAEAGYVNLSSLAVTVGV